MSKKKLLTAVISLVLVIAVALPGTLAVSNATATGETPATTTAPAEEVKCTCGAAEGEAHAATCALNNIPTEAQPTEGEPAQGETPEEKTCTCEAAEGEPHKEGCPLYVDPNAPAESTPTEGAEGDPQQPAETPEETPDNGSVPPEVLTCTCGHEVKEGELHKVDCPLYVPVAGSYQAMYDSLMNAKSMAEYKNLCASWTDVNWDEFQQWMVDNDLIEAFQNHITSIVPAASIPKTVSYTNAAPFKPAVDVSGSGSGN